MKINKFKSLWARFWMKHAGPGLLGKVSTYLAEAFSPPYYGKIPLSRLNPAGYFSPRCIIHHDELAYGMNIFVDDGVLIYKDNKGGPIEIGHRVHLHRHTTLQTGMNGSIKIGAATHVQPRCQFSAYMGAINIGERVEIAPNCAFYSYNHNILPDSPIREQPIQTTGGIVIGDDAWLGFGVIVLDGVRIGKGAVIGAGAVVRDNIPDGGIAVGVPAKTVKMRSDLAR